LCLENFIDPDNVPQNPANFIANHELPTECIDAITGGVNEVTLVNPAEPSGSIHRIFLEMEVKPINC